MVIFLKSLIRLVLLFNVPRSSFKCLSSSVVLLQLRLQPHLQSVRVLQQLPGRSPSRFHNQDYSNHLFFNTFLSSAVCAWNVLRCSNFIICATPVNCPHFFHFFIDSFTMYTISQSLSEWQNLNKCQRRLNKIDVLCVQFPHLQSYIFFVSQISSTESCRTTLLLTKRTCENLSMCYTDYPCTRKRCYSGEKVRIYLTSYKTH